MPIKGTECLSKQRMQEHISYINYRLKNVWQVEFLRLEPDGLGFKMCQYSKYNYAGLMYCNGSEETSKEEALRIVQRYIPSGSLFESKTAEAGQSVHQINDQTNAIAQGQSGSTDSLQSREDKEFCENIQAMKENMWILGGASWHEFVRSSAAMSALGGHQAKDRAQAQRLLQVCPNNQAVREFVDAVLNSNPGQTINDAFNEQWMRQLLR